MTRWDDLRMEFDAWADAGRRADLWLRDDDLGVPDARTAAFLDATAAYGVPACLAAIPTESGSAAAAAVAARTDVGILVHGYSHANHAPAGTRKAEFDHRPLAEMRRELAAGLERLQAVFGRRLLPVFVPPWNRMNAALVAELPAAGYAAVSTLGPRSAATPVAGLRQVNVHVDIIDWSRRAFRGEAAALATLVGHLQSRRTGAVDAAEPTGLLTHHRDHDAGCRAFLDRLFAIVASHSGVEWKSGRALFATDSR